MSKISIFGVLSNIQILVHTALYGTKVGEDGFGNRYYRGRPRRGAARERRWVIYAVEDEATQVPPEWHGWLHHQTNALPSAISEKRTPWIRPHRPNPTGTADSYLPPAFKTGRRDGATGDYTAWTPPTGN